MIVNASNLSAIFKGFETSFNKGLSSAPSHYKSIAMKTASATLETTYAWLGQMPGLKEWLGDKKLRSIQAHGYTIKNRDFESTVVVKRNTIEDDQYGVYGPLMQDMGQRAATLPDQLVFELLGKGFTTPCYDGQNFFDDEHPSGPNGESATNMQNPGQTAPWYLFDTSRAIKPIIYQERKAPVFGALDNPNDQNVFMRGEYIYGTEARGDAGFGLWQLAFGSTAALNAANFEAARTAMASLRGDEGHPLGISPTLAVVGPSNYGAARNLFKKQNLNGGESNIYFGAVEVIEVPWLA